MKRTLLIGLIALPLCLSIVSDVNATPKPREVEVPLAIQAQAPESNEPFVIDYFNNIYSEGFMTKQAQFIEMTAQKIIEEQKRVAEEERRRLEEERLRLEEEARKAEELRQELIRQDNVRINSYDVAIKSNITSSELSAILYSKSSWSGLAPYASYFIEAEETYGVNAFFICAIAAQESGWGKHAGGNGTNITGYAVYTSNHEGTTFDGGVRENILKTAELLANNYLDCNGKYHTHWDGYTGRSIWEINQRYCLLQDQVTVDNDWSKNLYKIANDLEDVYHETIKGQA